jgi:hypothetical protein
MPWRDRLRRPLASHIRSDEPPFVEDGLRAGGPMFPEGKLHPLEDARAPSPFRRRTVRVWVTSVRPKKVPANREASPCWTAM